MNIAYLYLAAATSFWLGIGLVCTAPFRSIFTDSNQIEYQKRRTQSLFLGILGIVLVIASQFIFNRQTKALHVPVVWPVTSIWSWLSVALLLATLAAIVQLMSSSTGQEKQANFRKSVLFGTLTLVTALIAKWQSAPFELLRGQFEVGWLLGTSILILFALTWLLMIRIQRVPSTLGKIQTGFRHFGLILGSIIFGLPFFWMLITSFKEPSDLGSTSGLVWIPKVTETDQYFDPTDPIISGTLNGSPVEGRIAEKLPDGSAVIDIIRPGVFRGQTFVAKPPFSFVPKIVQVCTAQVDGITLTGLVIQEFEDGRRKLLVRSPETEKGKILELNLDQITPVRHIGLRFKNYGDALDFLPVETKSGLVYLKNSLILVFLNVLGTLISSSLVAFAFARLNFPFKKLLFSLLLSTMMLPAVVTLLPTFLIYRSLGWIDTLKPLWVPAFLGSAFNIFLLRQFFASIPLELEDASKIDGCGYFKTFWSVMLPQIKPALSLVGVTTAIGAWNNFMGPLIYLNSPENMPVSYAIQLFQSDRVGEFELLMAFATMAMMPVILLFVLTQRFFVEGSALTGLGGR